MVLNLSDWYKNRHQQGWILRNRKQQTYRTETCFNKVKFLQAIETRRSSAWLWIYGKLRKKSYQTFHSYWTWVCEQFGIELNKINFQDKNEIALKHNGLDTCNVKLRGIYKALNLDSRRMTNAHCVKYARIWVFSDPHFLVGTKSSLFRKIRVRKKPYSHISHKLQFLLLTVPPWFLQKRSMVDV